MEQISGLTSKQAQLLLSTHGYNEISSENPPGLLTTLIKVFREPMILILFVIGVIYLILGERGDSIALFLSVVFVVGITLYQERKTENALQALRNLASPQAVVIRDGKATKIPAREVVVDDIIVLETGSRVPADAVVITVQNLLCDESLLTGESIPVAKNIKSGTADTLYGGSLVVQGSGTARVTHTGDLTAVGKIGKSLVSVSEREPLLKLEIKKIVRLFGFIGLACCIALTVGYFVLTHNFLESLLRGLTLSMAMLPEEFPVVMTVFLALGAWRISRHHVLARHSQAIETLGATTVLCVDKTGTLTENTMNLATVITSRFTTRFPTTATLNKDSIELLKYAKLAGKRGAFDPLEKEINDEYQKLIDHDHNDLVDWHLLKAYDLSEESLSVTRVWSTPRKGPHIVSTKGAPESVIKLCAMKSSEKKLWLEKVQKLADNGERVLAVAKGTFAGHEFPDSQTKFAMEFLGLISFTDPLRPSIHASMSECKRAGIRVVMITGDYPGTAVAIARLAGVSNPESYLTGADLAVMPLEELRERLHTVHVFARVQPEQKLKIVEALLGMGEVVAMTGDGVNDAPALKAAHVGISMGQKGTEVAREASDLILLDDNFSSIVTAIRLGRRIYDNLQKAVSYLYAIHIPIAGLALIPVFFHLPVMLFPLHIAFLELIIDPACSLIFETQNSEADIMSRPPRRLTQPLFNRRHLSRGLIQGSLVLGASMAAFIIAMKNGYTEDAARLISFLTLVLANLMLIRTNLIHASLFSGRHHTTNRIFWIISLAVALSLVLIFSLPPMLTLFHFASPSYTGLFGALALALTCYVVLELLKLIGVRSTDPRNSLTAY